MRLASPRPLRSRLSSLSWLVALATSGCGSEGSRGGPGSGAPSSTGAPSTPQTASTTSTTSTASTTRPRPTSKPERLTSPIRENAASGPFQDGAAFEVRLFVSKLTPSDPVRLALRFKLERPLTKDDPQEALRKATIDAAELLPKLRFVVTAPDGGKTTLETSEKLGHGQLSIPWFDTELSLDGRGVSQHGKTAAWKTPAPALFEKPGKYGIAVSGQLDLGGRAVTLSHAPLELEITGATPSFKPLSELSADAARLVQERHGLSKPPTSHTAIIDDVDDNRWLRYQLEPEGGAMDYRVEIVEVLLDPGGRAQHHDVFSHFTCVAEGVSVATVRGDVPIEALAPGDVVRSYDVARGRLTTATVEHVRRGHAEQLMQLGQLFVTGAHPIFVDGRFELAAHVRPGEGLLTLGAAGLGCLGARGCETGEGSLTSQPASPTAVRRAGAVIELGVSAPHTYFAGGVLVHNKAVYEPVGGQSQPYRGWFYRRAARR